MLKVIDELQNIRFRECLPFLDYWKPTPFFLVCQQDLKNYLFGCISILAISCRFGGRFCNRIAS